MRKNPHTNSKMTFNQHFLKNRLSFMNADDEEMLVNQYLTNEIIAEISRGVCKRKLCTDEKITAHNEYLEKQAEHLKTHRGYQEQRPYILNPLCKRG